MIPAEKIPDAGARSKLAPLPPRVKDADLGVWYRDPLGPYLVRVAAVIPQPGGGVAHQVIRYPDPDRPPAVPG